MALPAALYLWRDRAGRFSWLRLAVVVLLFAPGLAIALALGLSTDPGPAIGALAGGGDARPVNLAIHETGRWAIRFLLVTLLVTPAAVVLGRPRIVGVRRMLGLGAFAYAFVHLVLYAVEQHGDLAQVVREIALRFYLTIGFVALLALSVLAATSTDAMIRRLGPGWRRLHGLVYPLTGLALLHAFIQSKIDVSEAAISTGVFLWLMAWRLARRSGRTPTGSAGLLGLAFFAAAATALVEVGWYAAATGVQPMRVLAANLDPVLFPRPAAVVLMLGLAAVVVAAALRRWAPPARGRPAGDRDAGQGRSKTVRTPPSAV